MHSVSSYKYELLLFFFLVKINCLIRTQILLWCQFLILLKMLQTDSNITASNAWFKAGFWMENQLKFSGCGCENSLWSYTVKEAETVNEFLLHNFAILSSGVFFWAELLNSCYFTWKAEKLFSMFWKQTGYFLRSGEDKQYITEAVFSSHLIVLFELVAVFQMESNILIRAVTQTNLTRLSHCGSETEGRRMWCEQLLSAYCQAKAVHCCLFHSLEY